MIESGPSQGINRESNHARGEQIALEDAPDSSRALEPAALSGGQQPMPRFDPKARIIPHAIDSAILEYYRRLRTKLMQEHLARPFRSMVIASPSPKEGKTVTAINLAISLAMLPSTKVLLVDGDLRRGSVGKWLGIESKAGFGNFLAAEASLNSVLLKGEHIPMHIMLSGNSTLSPAELLTSHRLEESIKTLSGEYDFVIFDSAPINLVTDTQILASKCDAALLVARAYVTTRKGFEKAAHDFQKIRILGTILNCGTKPHNYHRDRGYYYSIPEPQSMSKKAP